MTKKEIVKAISDEIGLTQLKTKEIVQKTFDAIVDTLVEERRIELRNFGVFEVKKRAARKARNPRTGERVDVAEKYVVTFKPGKEMEERVRQLEEEANRARAAQLQAEFGSLDALETEPADEPEGTDDQPAAGATEASAAPRENEQPVSPDRPEPPTERPTEYNPSFAERNSE